MVPEISSAARTWSACSCVVWRSTSPIICTPVATRDNTRLYSSTHPNRRSTSGRTHQRLKKWFEGNARVPCVDYKITSGSLTDGYHFHTHLSTLGEKPEAHVEVIQVGAVDPVFIAPTPKRRAGVVAHDILNQASKFRIRLRRKCRQARFCFRAERDLCTFQWFGPGPAK